MARFSGWRVACFPWEQQLSLLPTNTEPVGGPSPHPQAQGRHSMPTWAGQAVPSFRAWPRALPQPVSPHHQDGRQPAGRPPPGSVGPGGVLRAPSLHRLRSAGTRPESSQAGAEHRAQHCTKASWAPGSASHLPRAPRTPRRSAPAAARPSSGLARPHPALRAPARTGGLFSVLGLPAAPRPRRRPAEGAWATGMGGGS